MKTSKQRFLLWTSVSQSQHNACICSQYSVTHTYIIACFIYFVCQCIWRYLSLSIITNKWRLDTGTDPPKASAQAALAQAPTTGDTCETVTAEQEKLQGNQASLMHPASPLHGPSGGHQQQQQQQQQQQRQAVIQPTLQGSIAAPPAERHIVGEELDNRASSAAPLLQHPQADTVPLTAAEHSMVHTQEAGSSLPARDVVREEESDPQASVAASQPDTAEQPPTSQLPKSGEPPTAHANDHQGEVLTSQDGGLPDSKADKGQAGAIQQAHEGGSTRQGYSPCGRERSHAKSRHRHIAAKAVDVEDGEMPSALSDGNTKALQTAADAVDREEPHPNAATVTAGPDELRASSGLVANSQHQALHGKALIKPSVFQVPVWLSVWGLGSRSPRVWGAGFSLGHSPKHVLAGGRMQMRSRSAALTASVRQCHIQYLYYLSLLD